MGCCLVNQFSNFYWNMAVLKSKQERRDFYIARFKNGEIRYKENAMFRATIDRLSLGEKELEVIESLLEMHERVEQSLKIKHGMQ